MLIRLSICNWYYSYEAWFVDFNHLFVTFFAFENFTSIKQLSFGKQPSPEDGMDIASLPAMGSLLVQYKELL